MINRVKAGIVDLLESVKQQEPEIKKWDKKDYYLFSLLSAVIFSLLIGTSIYSDDFTSILYENNQSFIELLKPKSNAITVPLTQYFFHIFYYISSYDFMLPVMLAKIFWAIMCMYGVSKYLSIWLDVKSSMIFSFIWVCIPLHDATFYWLIGQYLIVSCAFIFYAAFELERGNKKLCILFTVLGSWVSYGSPAVAFSFFIIFLLRGLWKNGLFILLPNIVYCIYYVICTKYFSVYVSRINTEVGLVHLVKNLFKQVFTFLDSSVGPSMFLKMFYTIGSINFIGIIFSLGAFLGIHFLYKTKDEKINPSLIIVLLFSTLLIFNIAMFTLTGAYPHLAFNLGNRVGTYSIFIVLFIVMVFFSKVKYGHSALILVLLLSFYGNRNKFLEIEKNQNKVVSNISRNQDLKMHPPDTPLFVKGFQYHRLGPFSDIEFLSENWVVHGILKSVYNRSFEVYSFNRRWIQEEGILIDRKNGTKIMIPEDGITVYDALTNEVLLVKPEGINQLIADLKKNKRHWLQFIENESVKKFINSKIKRLSYDL